MKKEESAHGKISEFFNPQDYEAFRTVYENAARAVVFIADADLRHQTEIDWQEIQAIRASSLGKTSWSSEIETAMDNLQAIIGSGSHTMLGKIYASFAAVDLIHQVGGTHSDTFGTFLPEAIQTAPSELEKILVTAAFYSRYMGKIMTYHAPDTSNQQIIEEFEKKVLGLVDSPVSARRKVAVQSAAEVFASEIHEDEFGMQLPEAELTIDTHQNSEKNEIQGISIPDKIMYLGKGFLVRWSKMAQAARFGVPVNDTVEERIPSLLVGVEIPMITSSHERGESKMGYIRMRALRKPRHGLIDWTTALENDSNKSFSKDHLFNYCSFDSLSFIAAVRVSRELTSIQTPYGFFSPDITGRADKMVKKMLLEYDTVFQRRDSILSAALRESNRIDGDQGWTIKEATHHVKSQIIGLLVKDIRNGEVSWRNEAELWEVYLTHVVNDELTLEDKMEMASYQLKDTKHEMWDILRESLGKKGEDQVVQWLYNGGYLPRWIMNQLTSLVTNYMKERCETIRNIHIKHPAPDDKRIAALDED